MRRIVRPAIALIVLAATAVAAAGMNVVQIDLTPFHAAPDVVDFVLAIAGPTAKAPGGRSGDRVVTIGRNAQGVLVVTSMQLVADGNVPNYPDGTLAVMIARHPGECQPPHGKPDSEILIKHIHGFFVDYRGETVWELGYTNGTGTFWQTKGTNDRGPEEEFNLDPAKYKTYPCDRYE